MKSRFHSSLAFGIFLLALCCSACTPPAPTPTPLANLDDLQTAPGHLNVALQAAEPDTFAGLWIEHEPEFRVIVLFTADGEKTLQPYIAGTLLEGKVEVRQAKYSLAQLTSTEHEINQLMREQALPFSASVEIQENRVVVYITDQALWENALRENGLALPDYVVGEVIYEPLQGQPDFPVTPVGGLFFPQLRARSVVFMTALLEGQLVLEDGCLRVVTGFAPQGSLIIWQPDYFPSQKGDQIEILDRNGLSVARVGESIALGGGEIQLSDDTTRQLRESIPAACAGPYFLMGEIVGQSKLTPAATGTPALQRATPTLWPTSTPGPATSVPTASATPTRTVVTCTGAPDTLLNVGDWVHVSLEQPISNRIRSTPNINSEMLGKIQPGEMVQVLDGPECADGYVWWFVHSLSGLQGWTAEGDSTGDWIVRPLDGFLYDTTDESSTSTIILEQEEKYRIILAGTYSLWIPSQWTDPGVCIWGKSDPSPMILSRGKPNGRVGLDPFVVYARPFYRNDCQDPNLVPAEERISRIAISLDGGVDYSIPRPVEAVYRTNHTYVYTVTGEGYPLKIRLDDPVLNDNYGQIFVMIERIKQ
ncbi:hypothetical protein LARV_00836 [Longilinea arvoryzae]|uniref:Protein containg bacterial SH3 domain n=1 Tax=Longilinea arvoryzae TaxID=360412 RepID=A0A0S7BF55_9CHLR|nr:SH3 domain-containing protein [Longilinea arvoryzae]GAP13094.1 hypothetical protein LARV_00836 [Longilinea arvoryzae]